MSVRETVLIGQPVLRKTALKVLDVHDSAVEAVIVDLTETMREEDLIGMAAPQIGESLQIFVSEIRETKIRKGISDELRVYINPEIIYASHLSACLPARCAQAGDAQAGETELDWEGCGSIPSLFGQVERAKEITLKYMDENGVSREMSVSGLLARVIQHEVDHLNGILFTDLADPKTLVSREYYLEHIVGE